MSEPLIPIESLISLRDVIKSRPDHRKQEYTLPGGHLVDMIEELIEVRDKNVELKSHFDVYTEKCDSYVREVIKLEEALKIAMDTLAEVHASAIDGTNRTSINVTRLIVSAISNIRDITDPYGIDSFIEKLKTTPLKNSENT